MRVVPTKARGCCLFLGQRFEFYLIEKQSDAFFSSKN